MRGGWPGNSQVASIVLRRMPEIRLISARATARVADMHCDRAPAVNDVASPLELTLPGAPGGTIAVKQLTY